MLSGMLLASSYTKYYLKNMPIWPDTVMFHIDHGGEQNTLYKDVETFP